MQQDKITIDLKLPKKWEDLTDKQLRYVFALLAQGFTAAEQAERAFRQISPEM